MGERSTITLPSRKASDTITRSAAQSHRRQEGLYPVLPESLETGQINEKNKSSAAAISSGSMPAALYRGNESDCSAAVFADCGHFVKVRKGNSDCMEQNMRCCGQNSHRINRKKDLRLGKNDRKPPKICMCGQNGLVDERRSDRSVSKVC